MELQNIDRHNFEERLLFYSSNVIANHCLKVGEDYDQLKNIKVYAIINYKSFNNNVKDIVRLKRNNKIFTKKLEFQIFDLTKVDIKNKDTKYYELVNLFHCHNIKKLEKIINNSLNKDILEIIKTYNLDEEEREKMEDIERLMMKETEHYETAFFDGIEVGRNEGRILGRSEGRNEGISLGISQGINKRNCEIAKNLINKNVDIDFIIDVTGLTYEQVSSLY